MDNIIGFIFELLFERWIVRFLGIRTRFIFLNILGKKVKLEELRGDIKNYPSQIGQDFLNVLVGILIFSLIIALLLYIFGSIMNSGWYQQQFPK